YAVKEAEANKDGYVTTSTGKKGTVPKNDTATANFTNTKNVTPTDPTNPDEPKDDTPQTGDNSNLLLWAVLLGLSGLGMTTVLILGKKEKYKPKHSK
ncbi:MAG: hypothetical protein HFJ84_04225, partial [Clostridiales bacterium]|nr:hypothetical protein [Clostridiales bacterium]